MGRPRKRLREDETHVDPDPPLAGGDIREEGEVQDQAAILQAGREGVDSLHISNDKLWDISADAEHDLAALDSAQPPVDLNQPNVQQAFQANSTNNAEHDLRSSLSATDPFLLDLGPKVLMPDLPGAVQEGHLNGSLSNQTDSTVWPTVDPVTPTQCSCLNALYSTLSSFQSLQSPSFPSSRGPLLKATRVARSVVRCSRCPLEYSLALQNLMLLTTLLPLITIQYSKLLVHIGEKALEGGTVTYKVGDHSPETLHLHTGTDDCPLGFDVELTADEWAAIARRVIKQDLYGTTQNKECLSGVVDELEQRQLFWHALQSFDPRHSTCKEAEQKTQGEAVCLQLVHNARRAMNDLAL